MFCPSRASFANIWCLIVTSLIVYVSSMFQTLWYWNKSYPLGLCVYFCRFHRSGWFSFLLAVSVACFTFHILPSFSVNCRRMLCCSNFCFELPDVFIEFAAFFCHVCVWEQGPPQKSFMKPHPNSSKMDLTNIPSILQAGRAYVLACLECIITKSSHTPLSNRGAGRRGTKNAKHVLQVLRVWSFPFYLSQWTFLFVCQAFCRHLGKVGWQNPPHACLMISVVYSYVAKHVWRIVGIVKITLYSEMISPPMCFATQTSNIECNFPPPTRKDGTLTRTHICCYIVYVEPCWIMFIPSFKKHVTCCMCYL